MSLRELQRVLPVPGEPRNVPTSDAVRAAEAKLGLQLPEEYKDYVRTYGTGKIDDFVWFLVPASPNPFGDLVTTWERQKSAFERMQNGSAPLSYDIHPAVPGLLPIGQTDNGDTIFYLCEGPTERWKVAALKSRDFDVRVFDLGLTDFIAAALRHELDVLPEDLNGDFLPIAE